jgi:PAS domain S-box-containing protein
VTRAVKGLRGMPASWNLRTFVSRRRKLGPSAVMEALAGLRGSKLGLRTHLVVFGLAIVVPVLLYSAFVLHRFTVSERASNERRALEIARSLSADIDREITAIITTLEALATSNAIVLRDFESFYNRAKQALRSRPWNVVLIDANRQQLINTRLPWGTPLPVSAATEPDLASLTRQSGGPHVSNLFRGTVAQRLIFSVSVPVRLGEEILPYALVMSLEPERLVEILLSESLPPGWLAAVADANNMNMARTRMAKQFLGRPVPEESLRQYGNRPEGVIETTDFEGQRALHAFHFSRLTGWRVAAWAPLSLVEAPLRQAWIMFFWSGATLLSLSVLLAIGVGRLMAKPIGELAKAGVALGQGKPVLPISSTLRDADELSTVLSNAAKELNARMRAQAHLAAIVSSSPSAIISVSPDGIIRSWNAAATSLFGYERSEAIGRSVEILNPEDTGEDFEKLDASVRAGSIVYADVVRRHKDSRLIDVAISVAPMYDDADELVGISSIVRDIGERKARERHIEFLMRELAHRSKNLLAVVQAIAGQTARHSPSLEEFQARFSQRVHAMARSQDLLVARDWRGASVAELVLLQLAPFAEEASSRIRVSGPELELMPDAVHPITLAVHELATNAAKYGALSVPDGRVAIAWELNVPAAGERRFRMRWQETNGPPVSQPAKKGFGHIVISDMVASSLRGQVTLEYASDGLRWTLDVPGGLVSGGDGA